MRTPEASERTHSPICLPIPLPFIFRSLFSSLRTCSELYPTCPPPATCPQQLCWAAASWQCLTPQPTVHSLCSRIRHPLRPPPPTTHFPLQSLQLQAVGGVGGGSQSRGWGRDGGCCGPDYEYFFKGSLRAKKLVVEDSCHLHHHSQLRLHRRARLRHVRLPTLLLRS